MPFGKAARPKARIANRRMACVLRLMNDGSFKESSRENQDDLGSSVMLACRQANLFKLWQLLNNEGSLEVRDKKGRHVIHHACSGHLHAKRVAQTILAVDAKAINYIDHVGKTPLMLACHHANQPLVDVLLEGKAVLDIQDHKKQCAVQYLCTSKSEYSMYILETLVALDPDSMNYKGYYSETPLMLACENGIVILVEVLLQKGASTTAQDSLGRYAIHRACDSDLSSLAKVKLLLAYNVESCKYVDRYSRTPLMNACRVANNAVVAHLLKSGANLDTLSNSKQHATHYACMSQHSATDVIETILEHEPNAVNYSNNDLVTPLMRACGNTNHSVVCLLFQHGAKLPLYDITGNHAIHYVCSSGMDTSAILNTILEHDPASVNHANAIGKTPLMNACKKNNIRIVDILIKNGANAGVQDKRGRNAIHSSCGRDNRDTSEVIKAVLAYDKTGINTLDIDMETPLKRACYWSKHIIVKLLLDNGARLDIFDKTKRHAIHYCCTSSYDAVSKIQTIVELDPQAVSYKDAQNRTSLDISRAIGKVDIAEFLTKAMTKIK